MIPTHSNEVPVGAESLELPSSGGHSKLLAWGIAALASLQRGERIAVSMLDVDSLQGALRMLFLLDRCGEAPAPGSHAAAVGAVAVITAEKKLQALHFWMRNPDYLAYELLCRVEANELDNTWIAKAEELLDSQEPELRLYPMLRHRFGAFEPIDDSFSYLAAAGLAECHRSGGPGQVQRTDLYLLPAGREAANKILSNE